MKLNRRDFLRTGVTAGTASVALSSFGGIAAALSSMQTHAATNTGDYKALVCVFLSGGMDNHDTIIPYDTSSYDRWAEIRSTLVSAYQGKREQDQLLSLEASNVTDYGGREFALPPELSGIHGLFQSGDAAIVGNVGPLIEPVTATEFEADTVSLPSRLFSHNDQQATWMSGAPEGAQYGWAGLFSDISLISGGNSDTTFANITTGGGELLLTGTNTAPYHVGVNGAAQPEIIEEYQGTFAERMRAHFRGEPFLPGSLLGQDINAKNQEAFDANEQYNEASGNSELSTEFPGTGLGQQLKAVANAIAAKDQLGVNRQVFAVSLGGFDTHSNQAQNLSEQHGILDSAIVSFHNAMAELGLNDNVTLFTASDFGRTLAINGDGTDHGWGSHHFVIGGGIDGQRIFGDIPISDFDHELDAGSGRLIPTMSVEQYAGALGQWYGLNEEQLSVVFPNLTNIGAMPTLFV